MVRVSFTILFLWSVDVIIVVAMATVNKLQAGSFLYWYSSSSGSGIVVVGIVFVY